MWTESNQRSYHAGDLLEFSYTAKANRLIGFSIISSLLTVITATIYRFWATTQLRKRIWAGAELNGQPLEYSGKASELFIGFILAFFVLYLPLLVGFGAYNILLGKDPVLANLIYSGTLIYLGLITPIAVWRARRYLLSRTSWRGIRFSLRGNQWSFLGTNILANVVNGITLGWYTPMASLAIAEQLWESTFFGEHRFSFNRKKHSEPLYPTFGLGYAGSLIVYGLAIAAFYFVMPIAAELFTSCVGEPAIDAVVLLDSLDYWVKLYPLEACLLLIGPLSGLAVLFVGMVFVWSPYMACQIRAMAACTSIGGVEFVAPKVKAFDMMGLLVSNVAITIFSLGLLLPLTHLRTFRFVWAHLEADGRFDFRSIEQSTDKGPGQGEGLADGMDIGAGF